MGTDERLEALRWRLELCEKHLAELEQTLAERLGRRERELAASVTQLNRSRKKR